mmetsp:Transcript_27321/g.62973  ORF Transcript_27321/g.62973 Transcript_27321/m.62973 type:complete len:986 (-) Transcript_27321:66-3023(-)
MMMKVHSTMKVTSPIKSSFEQQSESDTLDSLAIQRSLSRIERHMHSLADDLQRQQVVFEKGFEKLTTALVCQWNRTISSQEASSPTRRKSSNLEEETMDLDDVESLAPPVVNKTHSGMQSHMGSAEGEDLARRSSIADDDVSRTTSKSLASGRRSGVDLRRQIAKMRNSVDSNTDPGGTITDWPQKLTMRPGLEETNEEEGLNLEATVPMHTSSVPAGRFLQTRQSSLQSTLEFCPGAMQCWNTAISPESSGLLIFEVIGFVCLIYDAIMIPYVLAWEVALSGLRQHAAIVTASYWTINLLVQLRVGYYKDGDLVMDGWMALSHYLRTLGLLDLVICSADWFGLFFSIGLREAPLYNVGQACRMVKLLRLVWMQRLLSKLSSRSLSAVPRVVMQVFEIIFGIFMVAHFLACAWYRLGKAREAHGRVWLDVVIEHLGISHFDDLSIVNQYIVTLHWMTATITMANAPLVSNNEVEGVVGVVMFIFGLLFMGTIVSFFSTHAVQWVVSRQEKTLKLAKLQFFLKQRQVPSEMAAMVQRQARYRLAVSAPLTEQEVPALQSLSTSLRRAVLHASYAPHLCKHALFRYWNQMESMTLMDLCQVVAPRFYTAQDQVFEPLTDSASAFYVRSGNLEYVQDPLTSLVEEVSLDVPPVGSWICEATLWSNWMHVGLLTAGSPCELLSISPASVVEASEGSYQVSRLVKGYGRSYYMRIVMATPPFSLWPNDLHVPFTEASDLMGCEVGLRLIQRAKTKGQFQVSDEDFHSLREELLREECAVQLGPRGDLLRIVAVVALLLTREDGAILVNLGKRKGKVYEAHCVLPGAKRSRGMLPKVAMERFLHIIWPLEPGIRFKTVQHELEAKAGRYGLYTQYLRTVQTASFSPKSTFHDACDEVKCKPGCSVPPGRPPVFRIVDDEKELLFTWMPRGEFEKLRHSSAAAEVKEWVDQLEVSNNVISEMPLSQSGNGFSRGATPICIMDDTAASQHSSV